MGWQIVFYWSAFLGLRQTGKSENQSGALRAKTQFLQVVLSIIFLSDNIYFITKSNILENKPKGERLVNYFSKLYPKDNYRLALPARLLWMIDSRIQQGPQRGPFSLILWSQRTQKVTYLWRYGQKKKKKKSSGSFFFNYIFIQNLCFKNSAISSHSDSNYS